MANGESNFEFPRPRCSNPSVEHPSNTSDGFHTFDELYMHRMLLNAALFNDWARNARRPKRGEVPPVVKSYRHSDGELCFGGGWFIVVAQLPTGQISYHYEDKYYDFFYCVPHKYVAPNYDGHSPADVVSRLSEYLKKPEPLGDSQ